MHKITRISYNSKGWQRPTGEARQLELAGTYNQLHGFGHEDWLFRSEWLIDGWRYAFIQGINKSHAKLVKEGQPLDLTLFTIQPDKKRRYVATMRSVEVLDDEQAEEALAEFKRRGWFTTMIQEIEKVDGDSSALTDTDWAPYVLNVRYRLDHVDETPQDDEFAKEGDPVLKLMRYQLYDIDNIGKSPKAKATASGSTEPPKTVPYWRKGTQARECTPEHARMQSILMEQLKAEYPDSEVVREQDFIDVSVQAPTETLLFEIKSDLEPRTVIRLALGQILEYAYHPSRTHANQVRLIIVGRRKLPPEEKEYLDRLRQEFDLPVEYRVVSLSHGQH